MGVTALRSVKKSKGLLLPYEQLDKVANKTTTPNGVDNIYFGNTIL